MSEENLIDTFQVIEERFNRAMVSNDPDEIRRCITDDWVLVNPESGPVNGDAILEIIGNGMLSHQTMTKDIVRAERYGDVVVVTGRGRNKGTFQGLDIEADEWVTDIYIRDGDDWRCALTQLTPVKLNN